MKSVASILNTRSITRRSFFECVGAGIQGAALMHLFGQSLRANALPTVADLRPRAAHSSTRAKSVIHLFMNGGPSQMDLFDPKPVLDAHHGEPYFNKIAGEVENIKDAGALKIGRASCRESVWVSR